MPMAYGGGISTLDQIKEIFYNGVEKVILNTNAFKTPELVTDAARLFGNQSIVVSVDVKKTFLGGYKVFTHNGTNNTGLSPVEYSKMMQNNGAGEIILNSIDRDGTLMGYDNTLIEQVASSVDIPVIALGGAASLTHFKEAIKYGASAVAAGSMFVFQGPHRAVLISYPSQSELKEIVYQK